MSNIYDTEHYDFAAELLSSPAWAGFPKRYQCRVTLRGHRPGTLLPAELRAALLAAPGAVVTVDFDHRLGGLWGAAPGHGTLHHGQKRFTLTGPQLVGLLEDPDRGGEVAVAWHVPPPPLPGPDEVLVATMRIDLPPGIVDPDPADNFARRENPFSAAIDPNAIHAAPPGYVRPGQAIIYTIEFENEFEGDPFGAPAPRVRTVITLDENLVFDDGTFDYRPEFANLDIFDPAPLVRDEADFKVTFSDVSRRVAWKFDSLFLPGRPPGGDEGSGGGGTLYLKTRVRPDAPCGAEISMAATNYFLTLLDEEIDSLATDPPAVHVVDGTPPVSGVSVPAVSVAPGFTVVWAASDEHSGIKKVTVYGAAVGAGYEPLAVAEFALDNLDAGPGEVVSGAVPFTGELGRAYRFYSVAADRAGNVQAPSAPAVVMLGLMGDLDGDGRVTVADALLALRIALGQVAPTPAQLVLGDLVAPAGIHAADVIAILRRAAGP